MRPLPTDKLWLIDPTALANIAEAARMANGRLPGANHFPMRKLGETAIIEIRGPLTKDETLLQDLFGIASTGQIRRAVKAAAADAAVKEIVLRIDSPGGTVSGTDDLAMDVRAAAKAKPVKAFIEDMGASAAYYVASQASQVFANRNALVGSIGTYLVIRDFSTMLEASGIETHVIRAGKFKGIGVLGARIDEEQLALLQSEVDAVNTLFIDAVATGRRMSPERVEQLADGRVLVGQQAVTAGLIDGIRTLDEAGITQAESKTTPTRPSSRQSKPTKLRDVYARTSQQLIAREQQRTQTVSNQSPTNSQPRDYATEWNAAVNAVAEQTPGMSRTEAIKAVDRQRPGLREAMLEQHNRAR